MSILDFIEKLQKKPESSREKILAMSVILIMFSIIAIWAQTVRRGFSDYQAPDNTANPAQALWSAAKDGFGSAMDQFRSLKNI